MSGKNWEEFPDLDNLLCTVRLDLVECRVFHTVSVMIMLFIRRLIYDRILLIVSYVYVIDSIATADIDGSYCPRVHVCS